MAPSVPEIPQNNSDFYYHPQAMNQTMPPYYYYPQQQQQYPYYPPPHSMYPPVQAPPQMYPPINPGGNYPMMPPTTDNVSSMSESQNQKQTQISSQSKPVSKKKFKRRPITSKSHQQGSPSSIGRSRTNSRASSSYSNTSSMEIEAQNQDDGLPPTSSINTPKARSTTCASSRSCSSSTTSDDFNIILPAGNDTISTTSKLESGALLNPPETSTDRSLIPIPRLSPATSSSTSEPPPPPMQTSEKCWFRPENINDQVRIVVKPIDNEPHHPVFMNLPLYDALKVKVGSTLCMPATQNDNTNQEKNIYYTVLDPTIYPADGIPMPEILGLKLQIVFLKWEKEQQQNYADKKTCENDSELMESDSILKKTQEENENLKFENEKLVKDNDKLNKEIETWDEEHEDFKEKNQELAAKFKSKCEEITIQKKKNLILQWDNHKLQLNLDEKENEIKNLNLSKDQEISELKNQLEESSKSDQKLDKISQAEQLKECIRELTNDKKSKLLKTENFSNDDSDDYFSSNRNSLEFNPVHIKTEIPDVENSLPIISAIYSEPPIKKVKLEKNY